MPMLYNIKFIRSNAFFFYITVSTWFCILFWKINDRILFSSCMKTYKTTYYSRIYHTNIGEQEYLLYSMVTVLNFVNFDTFTTGFFTHWYWALLLFCYLVKHTLTHILVIYATFTSIVNNIVDYRNWWIRHKVRIIHCFIAYLKIMTKKFEINILYITILGGGEF